MESLTESQTEIAMLIANGAPKSIAEFKETLGSDSVRIIYGLRDKSLVRKDIFGRWELTAKGWDIVRSYLTRTKSVTTGAPVLIRKQCKYTPTGIVRACELDDGSVHVQLDRRMRGRSVFIGQQSWNAAYHLRSKSNPIHGKPFTPASIEFAEDGWVIQADSPKNGRHILLTPEQVKMLTSSPP